MAQNLKEGLVVFIQYHCWSPFDVAAHVFVTRLVSSKLETPIHRVKSSTSLRYALGSGLIVLCYALESGQSLRLRA
jgi:hypothetical protein